MNPVFFRPVEAFSIVPGAWQDSFQARTSTSAHFFLTDLKLQNELELLPTYFPPFIGAKNNPA